MTGFIAGEHKTKWHVLMYYARGGTTIPAIVQNKSRAGASALYLQNVKILAL